MQNHMQQEKHRKGNVTKNTKVKNKTSHITTMKSGGGGVILACSL